MKHRVRIHGKKPKEKAARRQPKVMRKPLTIADMVKAVRHRAWPNVMQALADGVRPDGVNIMGDPLVMAVSAIAPVRVVEAILKAGADPNAVNRRGETALFHATDPRICERLITHGANPQHRAKAGATALHVLADAGQDQAMRVLIAAGAQVDALDDAKRTPLARCVAALRIAAVEVLLAAGAKVDAPLSSGGTLLSHVIGQKSKSSLAIARLLVRAGADTSVLNDEQRLSLL